METPLLRVSRPVSACARCRNAKIRCDGKLPACSACERAGKGAECSSANDQFAKGKERSYVSSLESRIEKLEKQLATARAQRNVTQATVVNHLTQSTNKPPPRNEASDVDDLVSDFGYLSVNATASGYNGFDKEMSFARLVLSSACLKETPVPSNVVFPVREFAAVLIQECVEAVFVLYPILSETSIYGSLEAVYQHNGRYCLPTDLWNVRIVVGIGLLCRSRTKNDTNYETAVRHLGMALAQAGEVLQPGTIECARAILLLVLYSLLDPSHFSAWYLVGVASRILVDIGLHQESSASKKNSKVNQSRRRLFYCAYSLDRAISLTFNRQFSFTDDSINVDLPVPVNGSPFLAEQHLTTSNGLGSNDAWLSLVRFRKVQSLYYQELFGSDRYLLEEPWQTRAHGLSKLRVTFAEISRSKPEVLKRFLLLELNFMSLLLLWPQEIRQITCPYGTFLVFEYCISYIQTLGWLAQGQEHPIVCTNLEILRAQRVVQYLLSICRDPASPLFHSASPQQPSALPGVQLPSIRKRSVLEVAESAIEAILQIDQVVDLIGLRCGVPYKTAGLNAEISSILQALRMKQSELESRSQAID